MFVKILDLKNGEKLYFRKSKWPKYKFSGVFYGTKEFTPNKLNFFEEYYNQHCLNDLVVYDGIAKLIDDLKKILHLAVATNANSTYAYKMLNHGV